MTSTRTLPAFALVLLLSASSAVAAPIQWVAGNGHWYEVILAPGGITWDAAKLDAENRGGYLATLTSAAESTFAFDLTDSSSYWVYETGTSGAYLGPWLGGFQPAGSSEPGGDWTWLNSDGLFSATYVNWLGGEPTNGVGSPHGLPENVIQFFNYNTRAATWNDYPASLANPIAYVVEYDAMPTAVPEPATLLLVGAGAAATAFRKRRRG
jgi:hypothetical protein